MSISLKRCATTASKEFPSICNFSHCFNGVPWSYPTHCMFSCILKPNHIDITPMETQGLKHIFGGPHTFTSGGNQSRYSPDRTKTSLCCGVKSQIRLNSNNLSGSINCLPPSPHWPAVFPTHQWTDDIVECSIVMCGLLIMLISLLFTVYTYIIYDLSHRWNILQSSFFLHFCSSWSKEPFWFVTRHH